MAVGNKCDLENDCVVSTEQGQSFADEHGCKFMETSASDDVNVDEVRIHKIMNSLSILYMPFWMAASHTK